MSPVYPPDWGLTVCEISQTLKLCRDKSQAFAEVVFIRDVMITKKDHMSCVSVSNKFSIITGAYENIFFEAPYFFFETSNFT